MLVHGPVGFHFALAASLAFDPRPEGDLFVIYNHNVTDLLDRWERDSDALIVKLQHMFRR